MADLAPITIEGAPPVAAPPQEEVRAIPTEPGYVAFKDPEGELKSIPQANAAKALESGYRPATDAEVYAQQNGALGTAAATAFGVGRGATFGLFDPLAVGASRLIEGDAAAEETRRSLDLLKRGHETASLVGELGGSLVPLVFGAGAGAGETALAGESLLSRAAIRAGASIPRNFLEGAALGVGNQLSEDTLGNHDLVAQKYLSAALENGIFGTILGAGLHAGGGLVGDALAARGDRAVEKGALEAAGTPRYRSFGGKLADLAEEQAAKGAMPSASLAGSEMQKLGATAEEQSARVRRIGRTLLEEDITTPGATKAVQAERLTKRAAEVGDELGTLRKSLEKSVIRPSAEGVMKQIETQVLAPLMAKPFSAGEQNAIAPYIAEIADRVGGKPSFSSFEELHELRRALDDKLYPKARKGFAPPSPPAGFEHLEKVRGILESEYERAAEHAAIDLGEDVAQKYRVTKAIYSDLKTAEKWATKGAARDAQNRAVSLTDTIMVGAAIASGHPMAALAPVANKLMRTFGNQTAATIADKAARLAGVQRATEAFDKRLDTAVKGFFSGRTGTKATRAEKRVIDPTMMRALRAAVKDPAAMTERVAETVGASGLRDVAPKIAQGISSTIMRAAGYLQQNLPPEPPPAGFNFGPTKPRKLGPYAQAKAEGAIGALDMDGVLADIERGRVDRQKIEALRIINPQGHEAIVGALRRHGEAHQAELTHQQEVAMSILTGQPIGAMMQPRTIRGFQEAHSKGAPPDPSQAGAQRQAIGNASGGGTSRAANTYRSGTQRMEADDGV